MVSQEYSKQNEKGTSVTTTASIQTPKVVPSGLTRTLFKANALRLFLGEQESKGTGACDIFKSLEALLGDLNSGPGSASD